MTGIARLGVLLACLEGVAAAAAPQFDLSGDPAMGKVLDVVAAQGRAGMGGPKKMTPSHLTMSPKLREVTFSWAWKDSQVCFLMVGLQCNEYCDLPPDDDEGDPDLTIAGGHNTGVKIDRNGKAKFYFEEQGVFKVCYRPHPEAEDFGDGEYKEIDYPRLYMHVDPPGFDTERPQMLSVRPNTAPFNLTRTFRFNFTGGGRGGNIQLARTKYECGKKWKEGEPTPVVPANGVPFKPGKPLKFIFLEEAEFVVCYQYTYIYDVTFRYHPFPDVKISVIDNNDDWRCKAKGANGTEYYKYGVPKYVQPSVIFTHAPTIIKIGCAEKKAIVMFLAEQAEDCDTGDLAFLPWKKNEYRAGETLNGQRSGVFKFGLPGTYVLCYKIPFVPRPPKPYVPPMPKDFPPPPLGPVKPVLEPELGPDPFIKYERVVVTVVDNPAIPKEPEPVFDMGPECPTGNASNKSAGGGGNKSSTACGNTTKKNVSYVEHVHLAAVEGHVEGEHMDEPSKEDYHPDFPEEVDV